MLVELKQALVKENVQEEYTLATMPPNFYADCKTNIPKLESREQRNEARKLLHYLIRLRLKKIIAQAIIEQPNEDLSKKMAREEQQFFDSMRAGYLKLKDDVVTEIDGTTSDN